MRDPGFRASPFFGIRIRPSYFLPTIARTLLLREKHDKLSIFPRCTLCSYGWSVIGWIVALILGMQEADPRQSTCQNPQRY